MDASPLEQQPLIQKNLIVKIRLMAGIVLNGVLAGIVVYLFVGRKYYDKLAACPFLAFYNNFTTMRLYNIVA
jgi:hypothetical protein